MNTPESERICDDCNTFCWYNDIASSSTTETPAPCSVFNVPTTKDVFTVWGVYFVGKQIGSLASRARFCDIDSRTLRVVRMLALINQTAASLLFLSLANEEVGDAVLFCAFSFAFLIGFNEE